MCTQQILPKLIHSLKHSALNIKQLDQILSHIITSGLIFTKPTWNCILRAYSKSPTPIITILMYNHYMYSSTTIHPDNYTYPIMLNACARLDMAQKGKQVHARVVKLGLETDIYVQNALIHFYGSVGGIGDARHVFDEMPDRDVTSWNSIIGAYCCDCLSGPEGLDLFEEMIRENVAPDSITLVIVVSALAERREPNCGSSVHGYGMKVGLGFSLNLENALLGMYEKCGMICEVLKLFNEMKGRRDIVSHTILVNGYINMGSIDEAHKVFDQMDGKDLVLWNSMIHGYTEANRPRDALEFFRKMMKTMVKPDGTTIVGALSACACLLDLKYGRYIHRFSLRNNVRQDIFIGTALVDMYSKCGSLEEAMVTFYKMAKKDVFAWTTAIEALASHGFCDKALKLFHKMEREGVKANEATFLSVLSACRRAGQVEEGCFLFDKMVRIYDVVPKLEHFGCMIDLLSKAGMVNYAEELIKCIPQGQNKFVAYKTLLDACITYSKFDLGLQITEELSKLGSEDKEVHVLLSNFYAVAEKWSKVAKIRTSMKSAALMKDPGICYIDFKT